MSVVKIRFIEVEITKKSIKHAMNLYYEGDDEAEFIGRLDALTDAELSLMSYETLYRNIFEKDWSAFGCFLESHDVNNELTFNSEGLRKSARKLLKGAFNFEVLKLLKGEDCCCATFDYAGVKNDSGEKVFTTMICTKKKIKIEDIQAIVDEVAKVDMFKKALSNCTINYVK